MADAATVTLDDVRAQLNQGLTNAALVRKALGRGSYSTIQKHINALRSAQEKQTATDANEMPDAPEDLIASIWSHAWAKAQARTSGALAEALARVLQLEKRLVDASSESEAAAALIDELEASLTQTKLDAQEHVQALKNELETARADADAHVQESAQKLTEALSFLHEEKQGRAMDAAKHDAAVSALRLETDRLVQQLADLKSFFSTATEKKKSHAT